MNFLIVEGHAYSVNVLSRCPEIDGQAERAEYPRISHGATFEMRAKRMCVHKSFEFAYNTVAGAIVMLTAWQYLLLYSLCFLLDHLLPSRSSTPPSQHSARSSCFGTCVTNPDAAVFLTPFFHFRLVYA